MVHRWKQLILGLCVLAVSAFGQAVPRLDSASHAWFQRGTTQEITLTGKFLRGVSSVLLTGSGVSASVAVLPPPEVTLEASGSGLTAQPADTARSLSVQIVIEDEASLGGRELRVATSSGVSNPLTVQVSDVPEVQEGPPGPEAGTGLLISLPAGFSGVIGANTESDEFRFAARAGQKLIFDVQANRFGSPLDPTLVLLDATGKELARSEDALGLDPFLEFTVPTDGEYVARWHDLRFQGGSDYRYRILAGELPYLEFLFPFGGRRGTTVPLTLSGWNLDGAETMNLQVAADAPLGRQDIRARTARGLSNPRPFEAGDLPEHTESEPNNVAEKANPIGIPSVINGRMAEARDVDVFRIQSNADQKWVIEVQARRFGSPLDALLTLMDGQGAVLQRNDDADGPDARLEFDARKDAEYLVSIRDLTDRGGERFGYRMTIQPLRPIPDFTVRAPAGRFRVNQGGRTAVRCEVERRNGFDGVIRVTGVDLPSGVTATPLVLGPGANFGWLVLNAAETAPAGHHPLKLNATGEAGGQALDRSVQLAESGWLTILPTSPVSVEVAQASALVEQNAATTLDISVLRRGGHTGEIKVSAEDLPGVSIPPVTLSAGESRAKLSLQAAYNAEVGTRPVMVRAEAMVEGVTNVTYASAPVPLQTQKIALFLTAMLPGSPFFRTDAVRLSAVALPTNSVSSANQTEFVVKVDRRDLAEEIALAVEGLPPGVNATVVPIPADRNEAAIKLVVTDQAETGKEHQFTVTGSVTHGDRIWRQKTQPVTLLVTAPEKETAAATTTTTEVPPPGTQ